MIFQVDQRGWVTPMHPGAPVSEAHVQELIARQPEIIGGDGDLLLIRREQPIADVIDGGGRWSLDHLFVTAEAVPVLVEVKRASDNRLRREVVGQMLDYAANAVAHWPPGRVADQFAATCTMMGVDAEDRLRAFIGDQPEEDFWANVDANFRAGRVKLIFVADLVPPELARVVEFLDEQMIADVRAIELGWFEASSGVTALVPRVIGGSARTVAQKGTSTAGAASGDRLAGRQAYWTALIEALRGQQTGFDRIAPPTRGDISVGAGVSGARFKFSVTQAACDVVLYLDRSHDSEWNSRTFQRLLVNREAIEKVFGSELDFDEMPGDRATRILATRPTGWRNAETAGICGVADVMVKLQRALRDRLAALG